MYFVDGFVNGLEKKFPKASSNHDEITSMKLKTTSFLRQSGQKIRQIEQARAAIWDDPTQTKEAKAVNTWKYAKKQFSEIQKDVKKLPDLGNFIKDLESEMDGSIAQHADTNFGREARQRIASMDEKERTEFVSKAIRSGDVQTASYVLGAPAFLSGIPDNVHKKLKDNYRNQVFTEEMEAVNALKSLDTHLQKGLKAAEKTISELYGHASRNGAIDKSEKAQKLMNV